MIRAVFIDIDNTLLDFNAYVTDSMKEGFEKFGLPPYEDKMGAVFRKINEGLWQKIERGELDLEGLRRNRWNIIFSALGIDFDGAVFEDFFRERLFYSAVPVSGALEMLSYLAPKYILCAANFTPVPRFGYRVGVPRAGFWKEILNSDATKYGGSGLGNCGGMEAEMKEWENMPYSMPLTLPPLGIVMFHFSVSPSME